MSDYDDHVLICRRCHCRCAGDSNWYGPACRCSSPDWVSVVKYLPIMPQLRRDSRYREEEP